MVVHQIDFYTKSWYHPLRPLQIQIGEAEMGRVRGKKGHFEEEQVGPLAELQEMLAWDEKRDREKAEAEASEQIRQGLNRSSLQSTATAMLVLPTKRRVGVTLSISIATVEILERLSLDAGVKRGEFRETLLQREAERRWGGGKLKRKEDD